MSENKINYKTISGEFYDYKKTMKPEEPYNYDYSKTMTMKLMLSKPNIDGGSDVYCNIDQAMDIIKKTDFLTRGIKKIIYLVGWQYNGHDDKYPCFAEVNQNLKRPQDKSARDSLIWLMDEAFKYNTVISLHINMTDAYMDSPLWKEYEKNNLIAKDENGDFLAIGVWGVGKTAYQVWYKNEWESGYATKRIDKLLELLPVKRAGTIHIDAYLCRQFANSSMNEERQYRRKVFRYFKAHGIDVTSEFLYDCPGRDVGELPKEIAEEQRDDLVGLMPMAWWLNQSKDEQISRPRSLLCGGRHNRDLNPEDMGFLVGDGVHGEGQFMLYTDSDNSWEKEFIKTFCLDGLAWYYQNCYKLLRFDREGDELKAIYEDNLTVSQKDRTIVHNEVLLREEENAFIPVLWAESGNEIIAYSENGYENKSFNLPKGFSFFGLADIYILKADGLKLIEKGVSVENGSITLSIEPKQAVIILFYR